MTTLASIGKVVSSVGALTLVVQIRVQLSYYPGPDPGLCVVSLQNLYRLQMIGVCERASPANLKLQDLQDTGQH